VELGYNFELQHQDDKSKMQYDKALNHIIQKPAEGYQIAKSFQDHQKLDYALQSYQVMMAAFPTSNYYGQIAIIYGEKGEIENMFNTYLDMLSFQNTDAQNIQRFMGKFLSDDDQDANNILLRKILIKRSILDPKDVWYKMLSWLYLQQKDYSKALIQEKAIHLRNPSQPAGIIDLGKIAFEDQDYTASQEAFTYILSQNTELDNLVLSHYYLLECKKQLDTDLNSIDLSYQDFFSLMGKGSNTTMVQTSYAQFLTFYKNEPKAAIDVLQTSLKNNLNPFQKSEIKIMMADIMVFIGQYNQALVAYTQVQNDLKNHTLAQTARYKVAQTSYFEGDFEWANAQLKVLKKGTTKLIANDAIDLSLLISDNIAQDSIRTALKSYAKADLLAFQNKTQSAIDTLQGVLLHHKGHPIEDEALFKQAELFEKTGKFDLAEKNYLAILQLDPDDILIDDALYQLAVLYDEKLLNELKAKTYYEKIVLEQPSSIYLVPARKRYRELRGDEIIP
jgi:tetratricopeptide (TPR) repeat protein